MLLCFRERIKQMWRRVGSLSSLVASSKSRHLNQTACGFNALQMFSTQVLDQAESGISDRRRIPFVTFVLGGPGSGKGTQCMRIVHTFGFTHLSAGDLLRKEISSNSENGDNDRFLIDGFPRTEENRIAYERVIGAEPDIVLFFDCPEEEMVKRVLNRNQGRIDDNIDTVKERLKVFAELNLPVIKHYSKIGKLCKIDGTGSEDEIFERVRPIFDALRYQSHDIRKIYLSISGHTEKQLASSSLIKMVGDTETENLVTK
ncbi:adenylate kinase [Striga asiatica]|uniref:adenylate kinase n=1 Tax=Striga asiatica TaxID=4170 RepID=A0A5A7PQU5_STRAF|nr:adenylate kinase [Striga asiatica]